MHQKPTTVHTTLKKIYKSKPVIAAQIGLPLLVALGTNYLTGASMYQGIASGIAIAAISKMDSRDNHNVFQQIFINPLRHGLTSAIFYSAIQNAGLSHHSTMLLAKCCSTALFSSHNTSHYKKNFTYISFSLCAVEVLTSYLIQSTLGEEYYFAQFMANVVGRAMISKTVHHCIDPHAPDDQKTQHTFVAVTIGLITSSADVLAPITGTSPIVNLIPESVSTFVSSVVESVSSTVAAAVA